MNDLKNYWLDRLELKREIINKIKQSIVPPIYRKQLVPVPPIKSKKP